MSSDDGEYDNVTDIREMVANVFREAIRAGKYSDYFDVEVEAISLIAKLTEAGCVRATEDQDCECSIDHFSWCDWTPEDAYAQGKDDMRQAGFRRVVPLEVEMR